jgi:hypothetical protein
MDELGYFAEPGNRMGWLDGQSLRAARVVIDIGVHCGFPAPAEVGGAGVGLRQGVDLPDQPRQHGRSDCCASS